MRAARLIAHVFDDVYAGRGQQRAAHIARLLERRGRRAKRLGPVFALRVKQEARILYILMRGINAVFRHQGFKALAMFQTGGNLLRLFCKRRHSLLVLGAVFLQECRQIRIGLIIGGLVGGDVQAIRRSPCQCVVSLVLDRLRLLYARIDLIRRLGDFLRIGQQNVLDAAVPLRRIERLVARQQDLRLIKRNIVFIAQPVRTDKGVQIILQNLSRDDGYIAAVEGQDAAVPLGGQRFLIIGVHGVALLLQPLAHLRFADLFPGCGQFLIQALPYALIQVLGMDTQALRLFLRDDVLTCLAELVLN